MHVSSHAAADSGVIDHAVRCTDADMPKLPEALKRTCALWFDEFGQEYFEGAGPRGEGASFSRQGDVPPYFVDCILSARVETEGDRRMYHDISSVQASTKSPYPASACPFGCVYFVTAPDLRMFGRTSSRCCSFTV